MSQPVSQRIILIGGPTASGKSALAMGIARQVQGSIINADAMQIYAGLPILTAQPDAKDRDEIPHLLYEVTDASEASSVGKWLALAQAAIEQVLAEGRTPILVGGTGMYFKALLEGLAEIPDIPDAVRDEAEDLYQKWGEEKFRAALAKLDSESDMRIARNDRQRLVRAYAVATHTGKSLKEWQRERPEAGGQRPENSDNGLSNGTPPPLAGGGRGWGLLAIPGYEFRLLLPPREELYAACDKRFLSMIERGAINEVKKLMARNLSPALPAMKILGVREIAAHLRGEISLKEAIAKAQQMTRNYAKRQMTWFRNQWRNIYLNAI